MLSDKTTKVLAVFTAVATTAAFSAWLLEEEEIAGHEVEDNQILTDDNGQEYTLTQNEDGTETATYEDGRTVTFRRNEDGSLDFLSGSAGLLAGLAAGYFMFHGLSTGGGGHYNTRTGRYTTNEPVRPVKDKEEKNSTSRGSGGSSYKSKNTGSSTVGKSSKSSGSVKSSASTGAKSGFGSAGARSSSS